MRPSSRLQHLHLIHQTKPTHLQIPRIRPLPPVQSTAHRPLPKPIGRRPPPEPISPQPREDLPWREPVPHGMDRSVRGVVVSHPHPGIEEHAVVVKGVVRVDQTALGAFEVRLGQGVGDSPEA